MEVEGTVESGDTRTRLDSLRLVTKGREEN